MTDNDEVKLLLLMSLIDLGGNAAKRDVLDNIERRQYCKFTDYELTMKDNRPELVWRNRFAWVRKALVDSGHIDDPARDRWTITPKGRNYLIALCAQAAASKRLERLNQIAITRCRTMLEARRLDQSSRSQRFPQTNG